MQTTLILPLAALFCGVTAVLAWMLRTPLRRHRRQREDAERIEAYRRLYVGLQAGRRPACFSYRPATRELVVDPCTARMHGLDPPVPCGEITLAGWHQLPAAARAAGWIDEALADGLQHAQPVCCEYLARLPGRPDLHVVLTAMPAPRSGLMVGTLAERAKA
ncbi:hypothetical protein GN316_11750 [Xylophilus sp. Kf1]|nr:hypothetical protein [Xylophilus sp. Kf1]